MIGALVELCVVSSLLFPNVVAIFLKTASCPVGLPSPLPPPCSFGHYLHLERFAGEGGDKGPGVAQVVAPSSLPRKSEHRRA